MKAMLCKPVAVASWVAVALKWLQHHRRGHDDCDRVRTCIHCVEYFLHQPRKTSSSSDRGCPKIPILQFFSKLFKLGGTEDGLTWVGTSDTFASKKILRGYGRGLSSPPYGICAYLRHFFLGWPLLLHRQLSWTTMVVWPWKQTLQEMRAEFLSEIWEEFLLEIWGEFPSKIWGETQ